MTDSIDDSTTRSLLQHVIFALLVMIGLLPFLLMLWNCAAHSEWLRRIFCCKHCIGSWARRVYYDEADLRMLRELEQPPQRERVGINGAYRMYQARSSRLSLHLTSWREDIKRDGGSDGHLQHKLAQIRAAQHQHQPSQEAAADATASRALANRAISKPTVPFGVRVVGINGRVDGSSSSIVAMSSNSSEISMDSDDESGYTLVAPTPKNKPLSQSHRRSIVIEEEEEKKEDAMPRDHEIV